LLAQIGCAIPVVIGFLLPAILLVRLAMGNPGDEGGDFSGRFVILARNSLLLAAVAASTGGGDGPAARVCRP
jgi:iron(III) transport system permease protein